MSLRFLSPNGWPAASIFRAAGLLLLLSACTTPDRHTRHHGTADSGGVVATTDAAKPDFTAYYHWNGTLDIGLGPTRENVDPPTGFTLEELKPFWKRQTRKDYIVVTLWKDNRTEGQSRALIERLNDYFFEAGFRRVRIHQEYGTGIGVVSDTVKPPKTSR